MKVDDDRIIDALGSALQHGGTAIGDVPDLLKRVLSTGVWREFTTRRSQHVTHERFADFVTTPPLAGLGSDVDLVRRIVAGDIQALDLLDRALQNPVGTNVPVSNSNTRRSGTTKDAALRRLRKDAPELHADVLAGRLTAHAAMVAAGFRPPTFTVRADSPESVAASLRRQLPADVLAKVASLLGGD